MGWKKKEAKSAVLKVKSRRLFAFSTGTVLEIRCKKLHNTLAISRNHDTFGFQVAHPRQRASKTMYAVIDTRYQVPGIIHTGTTTYLVRCNRYQVRPKKTEKVYSRNPGLCGHHDTYCCTMYQYVRVYHVLIVLCSTARWAGLAVWCVVEVRSVQEPTRRNNIHTWYNTSTWLYFTIRTYHC